MGTEQEKSASKDNAVDTDIIYELETPRAVSKPIFFVGTHRFSYRAGEPGEVVGLRYHTVENEDGMYRMCYAVKFEDGEIAYYPMSDVHHYKLIPEEEVGFVTYDEYVKH